MSKLEDNIQQIRDNLEEITNVLDELDDVDDSNIIKNLDNFIFKLKIENLYTEELETFIDNYMKFHND